MPVPGQFIRPITPISGLITMILVSHWLVACNDRALHRLALWQAQATATVQCGTFLKGY